MKFKKFTIHNYKQHTDREQKLDGNLIGIIGPNGSGKSNLLGALQFALSGEQPGFTKPDLLRWGAVEGSVEVEFEHNNKQGRIRRDLHANNAIFNYEGMDTIRGISKVNNALDEIMGIDRDLLKQAVFVRQAEIDAILFTDPKIRELSFQRLCGIGDAAKIHKRLGELIAQLGVPVNYDTGIAEGELRLGQLQTRVSELTVQCAGLSAKRNTIPVDQLTAELKRLAELRSLLELLPGVRLHLQECEANNNGLVEQLQKAKAELPVGVDMGEIDKSIAQCYDLIKMIEAREMTARNQAQAEADHKALGDMPIQVDCPYTAEQVDELKRKNEAISQAYHEVMGNLKFYTGLAAALAGKLAEGVECPVCGNPLKDAHKLETRIAELQGKLNTLKTDTVAQQYERAAAERSIHLQCAERTKAEWGARAHMLADNMARWGKQLNQLPVVQHTKDEVQKRILEFAAVRDVFVKVSNTIARLTASIEANTWDWSRCKEQYAKLVQAIKANTGTEEVFDIAGTLGTIGDRFIESTRILEEAKALDRELAGFTGMLQECEAGLATVTVSLQTLKAKRDEQAGAQAKLKILNDVRDWFHYNNGPHTMAASVLSDMTQDVNTFLGHFGAEYSVINTDDGVGFKYRMHTGSDIPVGQWPDAYHLSGGQRIQLAISFRFAAYMMFASKLGLISLDEPTVYLDDRNIGNFCTLLGPIRDLAKKMNLQILIATHERAVLPFMDSIIDLATV